MKRLEEEPAVVIPAGLIGQVDADGTVHVTGVQEPCSKHGAVGRRYPACPVCAWKFRAAHPLP